MTAEMQLALQRELEDAKDPTAVSRAQSHIMIALMDCQRKTAERVKELVAERKADENRKAGAKWVLALIITVASTIGPTVALIVSKMLGVFQ